MFAQGGVWVERGQGHGHALYLAGLQIFKRFLFKKKTLKSVGFLSRWKLFFGRQ